MEQYSPDVAFARKTEEETLYQHTYEEAIAAYPKIRSVMEQIQAKHPKLTRDNPITIVDPAEDQYPPITNCVVICLRELDKHGKTAEHLYSKPAGLDLKIYVREKKKSSSE
jgi:hypothetical protein